MQLPEMGSVASKKDGGSIVYNSILIEFDLTVKVWSKSVGALIFKIEQNFL